MSRSAEFFLKPTHYISEEDHQLQASVQMICEHKQKGGLSGHALAVSQAVRSIALALLVNTPYHLTLGSKNFILNCVHLNLELIVLGHYSAVMQNLIYSVIATIYVAIGTFIPPVLNGFKMEKSQFDDSNSLPDSITRSPNLITQNYMNGESLTSSYTSFNSSIQNEIRNENRESISSQQNPSQVNSMSVSSIIEANSDWEVVSSDQLLEVVSIEASGVNLENQAHRVALNEYIRILWDRFKIDINKELTKIESCLKSSVYQDNSLVNALYCTLCYLTARPIAYGNENLSYTNAKEQYMAYVSSLWLVTKKYREIRKESNSKEFKDYLSLIRALCEARFLSENHGLLQNLLQLHKERYDRDHEITEVLDVTREDFGRIVRLKNEKVAESPASMKVSIIQKNLRKLLGAMGYEYFLKTDIPFLRGMQIFKNNDTGKERIFYYMRHPTPHDAGSLFWISLGTISRLLGLGHIESGEVIAPEFEVMLEAIAEREEAYLIQSHQRLNDSGIIENEDSRSQTLYRLQETHKNFHVVFQAVEGDLFNRKGSYAEITKFAELKKAIKESFYKEGSPNRLPFYLEGNEGYLDVMGNLLDDVHKTLFGKRDAISFDGQDPMQPGKNYPNYEWQAFILAFYILQGDDLKFRLPNVKYFCTNCKNFFDRGGDRAMAEDRLHQEMSKQEVTSEDLEATIANLIPVPLQSKGQSVIKKRLQPGTALAEILASLKDKKSLQEIKFKGYQFNRFEISKREQRAIPLLIEDVQLKKAQTFQEVQEVLKPLQSKSYLIPDNKIIQKNWAPYQGKEQIYLFDQVDKGLKRFTVHVNGTLYNAQDSNNDAKVIFDHLKACGISEEVTALQAMAQIQQSIFLEPWDGLKEAFQHDRLGLIVAHDLKGKTTILVTTTGDTIEIKAQNRLSYKITDLESSYFRESPIAIFNTKVLVTIPKDGSASHAHWTWEVADVL